MTQPRMYKDAIREAMIGCMRQNPSVVVMGQGVTDPTGIFGTTTGLKEEFGADRLIDTPISEDGSMGFAVGLSLNGTYPIQTHIRVDFLILAMNQLLNVVAKYKYMYGGNFEVPMLIRAVIGRSWGQGPQHSQSLQSLLSHIPGLTVIMPSNADDVHQCYMHAVNHYRAPVVSIEHRYLYDISFNSQPARPNPFSPRLVKSGNAVTIVATSYMVQEAQLAAQWIKDEQKIECEIIDPVVVSQLDHDFIFQSVEKTGRLLVADTSWLAYGVCSEVARGISERNPRVLEQPMVSVGLKPCPTPTSHALEKYFYPDMRTIVDGVYSLVFESKKHGKTLPTEEYVSSLRKKFRGPF